VCLSLQSSSTLTSPSEMTLPITHGNVKLIRRPVLELENLGLHPGVLVAFLQTLRLPQALPAIPRLHPP
jgi:hypothetical protein